MTLPSKDEWEKAGRGADGPVYPWGDQSDPERANYNKSGTGETSAVGCFTGGASPYGLLDMSGDVREWTRSLWGDYPYPEKDSIAEGEGAVAVGKDGIYVHGNVAGDVLGGGARKVTITEETTSRCMDCQTRTCLTYAK